MQAIWSPSSTHPDGTVEAAIRERYGERGAQTLARYNPDHITTLRPTDDECFFGDAPTLDGLARDFDTRFPVLWLMAQLADLSEYCGSREKLCGTPLRQLAQLIAHDYGHLRVTEILLFLHRFKAGRYGRFFGAVDPLVITTALRDFLSDRTAAAVRREAARPAFTPTGRECTYDDYRRQAGLPPADVPKPAQAKPRRRRDTQADAENEARTALLVIAKNPALAKKYTDVFRDKYGCSPREYLKQHAAL